MGRLAMLFAELSSGKSDWVLQEVGNKQILERQLDSTSLPCSIKVEEHNPTHFKYSVAIRRGTNVSLAQRPYAGATANDLANCLVAATEFAEKMLAD